MSGFQSTTSMDPLDLEIEPGRRVRDLKTPEECASAVMQLDMGMESIMAQIGRAEADPDSVEPGWRTRAQSAMRWKKRVRRAVLTLAETLRGTRGSPVEKRQAILDVVRDEIGKDEYERLVAIAKTRHPELGWSAN